MSETREEKFIRLAQKRVPTAMEKLRLIGQLSSANYSYTPEAAAEIVNALRASVEEVAEQFGVPPVVTEAPVSLDADDAEAGNPQDD